MTIRSIAILSLIGISVCVCGCLDVESNCQHEINQAVADRDAEWQQVLADRDDMFHQAQIDRDAEWEAAMKQKIAERDAPWQQAVADRDVQWQNAIRQSTDQQALDFIMQILPLMI